jgi:hypothetical protein
VDRIVFWVLASAAIALAGFRAFRWVRAYLALRGTRVVTCPGTGKPAAVELDILDAATSASFGGTRFHLQACSFWPERAGCGQGCLKEVVASPESCLVRRLLVRWYAGASCILCRRPFAKIDWTEHRPGLRAPDGQTIGWDDVDALRLHEILATHRPVCWSCHMAETFRRRFPDRVLDRPAPPDDHLWSR